LEKALSGSSRGFDEPFVPLLPFRLRRRLGVERQQRREQKPLG
jgi:hypothetical protein